MSARFAKTGGTIYGYDPEDLENSNTVKDSSGVILNNYVHAVYFYEPSYCKETTLGLNDNLFYK